MKFFMIAKSEVCLAKPIIIGDFSKLKGNFLLWVQPVDWTTPQESEMLG